MRAGAAMTAIDGEDLETRRDQRCVDREYIHVALAVMAALAAETQCCLTYLALV